MQLAGWMIAPGRDLGYSRGMTQQLPASPESESIMMIRSVAHVGTGQPFEHGVTDAQMATLMYALESGLDVHRTANGRWFGTMESSFVVQEAIRTGLVVHFRATRELPDRLVPAMVHLACHGRSACSTAGEGMGPKRVRITDDATAVDCLRCFD